jgi:hypothetical protein
MHKSLTPALVALLLIASPLMMFGTSNSDIFSKAMAIEKEESEKDLKPVVKSNDKSDEEKDDSSDEEKDDSSDEEKDDSSDEEKDDSSDAIQQNQNNEPQQQQSTSQQNQNDDEPQQQITQQPQQKNKQLSIISQEEMQQQQYENFKKLYESVKQQHKEIQVLK